MTLQEIVNLRPFFLQRKVKETATQIEKTFDRVEGANIIFKDGTVLPLSTPGWETVESVLQGKEKHIEKKEFCIDLLDEFEGENLQNVDDGIWPYSYIQEMLADPDIMQMAQLAGFGVLEGMYNVASAKLPNLTWYTQERKDYYTNKMLAKLSELG